VMGVRVQRENLPHFSCLSSLPSILRNAALTLLERAAGATLQLEAWGNL
jgi:hypothetical protein